MTNVLPPPPVRAPLVGPDGVVSVPWLQWFRQAYMQMGGSGSPGISDLAMDEYLNQPPVKNWGKEIGDIETLESIGDRSRSKRNQDSTVLAWLAGGGAGGKAKIPVAINGTHTTNGAWTNAGAWSNSGAWINSGIWTWEVFPVTNQYLGTGNSTLTDFTIPPAYDAVSSVYRHSFQGNTLQYATSRTNRIIYSEPLLAQLSSKSATVTQGSLTDHGLSNGITFPAAAQADSAYQAGSTTAGQNVAFSIFVKMTDGGIPVPGTNISTGDFCVRLGGGIVPATSVTSLDGGLYQIDYIGAILSSGSANGIARYSGQSGRGFTVTGWFMQIGSLVLGSYFKTTGTARTITDYAFASHTITFAIAPDTGDILTYSATSTNPILAKFDQTAGTVALGYNNALTIDAAGNVNIYGFATQTWVTTNFLGIHATADDSTKFGGQLPAYYQTVSTAINTSNIGSQSVLYAASAGTTGGSIVAAMAAPVTVANTSAETTLLAYTLAAGALNTVGKTIAIDLWANIATLASTAGTQNCYIYLGGVLLATIYQSVNMGTGPNPWKLTAAITTQTTGATGTVFAQADRVSRYSSTTIYMHSANTGASTAINLTAELELKVTWKWQTANSSNTFTATNLIFRT